jgi:hypothetical protein
MDPSAFGTIRGNTTNEKGDTRYFVISKDSDKIYEIDISKKKIN